MSHAYKEEQALLLSRLNRMLEHKDRDLVEPLKLVLDAFHSPLDLPNDYLIKQAAVSKEEDVKISYPKDLADPWNPDRRYKVKFSRWLSKLKEAFGWSLNVDRLSDLWTETVILEKAHLFKLDLLSGNDISDFYGDGAGGIHSCMVGAPCYYFDVYVHNPDKINLALLLDDKDRVVARAILWKKVKRLHDDNIYTLLGRIYAKNGLYQNLMKRIALKRGWLVLAKQNSVEDTWLDAQENEYKHFYTELSLPDSAYYSYFPYVDNFQRLYVSYRNSSRIILSTFALPRSEFKYSYEGTLTDTSGGPFVAEEEEIEDLNTYYV